MFPATITLHTPAQLNAVMRALGETPVASIDVQAIVNKAEANTSKPVKTETVKADRPAATEKAQADPKPEPDAKTVPSEPTAGAEEGDAPAFTYRDDIKPRVLNAVKAGKREEMVALLTSFKVDHAEKMTADQYPDFVAQADKLLGV